MGMKKMGPPAESPAAHVAAPQVTKLVKAAIALNRRLGDPREAAGTR
jgi:hypothetical protein